MKWYKVQIETRGTVEFTVEAESEEEAIRLSLSGEIEKYLHEYDYVGPADAWEMKDD